MRRPDGRRVRPGGRGGSASDAARRDARLVALVADWFERSARAMPWRTTPRDPWHALVSEAMLQQTQASRVLERFPQFIARFPTPAALARASEDEVLAAWRGMGYYRRALHLRAAAARIVAAHAGRVPDDPGALRALPGVGRYTAGAVASIVFGRPEAIVDANVLRVLSRVEGRRRGWGAPASAWAWSRAAALAAAADRCRPSRVALFNEGLMELGATVCVPRAPRCGACPLRGLCEARARGVQHRIPPARPVGARRRLTCHAVVVRDGLGRVLVERRGSAGMWHGLWQAPTWERAGEGRATPAQVAAWLGVPHARRAGSFEHPTTHRRIRFVTWDAGRVGSRRARALLGAAAARAWASPGALDDLPMSSAQRRILADAGG